jgi:hypothetical protein
VVVGPKAGQACCLVPSGPARRPHRVVFCFLGVAPRAGVYTRAVSSKEGAQVAVDCQAADDPTMQRDVALHLQHDTTVYRLSGDL